MGMKYALVLLLGYVSAQSETSTAASTHTSLTETGSGKTVQTHVVTVGKVRIPAQLDGGGKERADGAIMASRQKINLFRIPSQRMWAILSVLSSSRRIILLRGRNISSLASHMSIRERTRWDSSLGSFRWIRYCQM